MLRILRAFAWLRWRTLLNSLERTGSRDMVGRMSTALEQLAPVVMALVMLPTAVALAGVAGYAGWALAVYDGDVLSFQAVRLILLGACLFAVVGPFLLPARASANPVRVLLLPIPRRVLFAAQVITAFAEPWLLLAVAPIVAVPIGLAAGGQLTAAGIAFLAGALLLAALAGITLIVTSAIELVLRNRRRGEMLALVLFLLLPLVGIMAGLTDGTERGRERQRRESPAEARPPRATREWTVIERRTLALLPSESYAAAVRAARAEVRAAGWPLLVLTGTTALLHVIAFAFFGLLLGSPGAVGSKQGRFGTPFGLWRIPGLSPGASAIATSQVRLALRTPRGRFTLLSPLVMFMPFAVMLLRSPAGVEFAFVRLQSGVGLAAFTSFIALLAVLPFAANQFAVDRAGLTLALLAPLETRTLLAGKAAGNAIVAAVPAAICIAAALALFPAGDPALWACVPLTLAVTYVLGAPAVAALSAVFPRSVDLNSIGRGSNAHGAAAFLGTLTYLAAGASCLLLILVATLLLNRPGVAPLLLFGWLAICGVSAAVLFRPVAALFERRREHLGMLR